MEKHSDQAHETLQSFISDGTPAVIKERYASLSSMAAKSDYGELDHNIVVLDTETTGISFNHDELTQIAAARMEKGQIVDWFTTFVNPEKPIPEEVSHLTNIHDDDVVDAPLPSEALSELVKFVGDAKLVAHNAAFDRTFLTRHPEGYSLLENIWIDSLDLARIALPRLKSHRLIDLVTAFGAPLSTHRADADVEATCSIFRILLAAVSAMPAPLVREIARMATPEQWSTQVVFDYFARQGNIDSGIIPDQTSKTEHPGSQRTKQNFSLHDLRYARIAKLDREGKIDADALARDPLYDLVFPSSEEINAAFASDGLVGRLYQNFEPRVEQLAMAEAVSSAFAASENLMVEAGTGVGKSMAYLVPAALAARKNNIGVGIATKTNALLDQLIYHELPALSTALEELESSGANTENSTTDSPTVPSTGLTYAALKGFSHYPCLRKIERLVADGPGMRLVAGKEKSQAPALVALLSYIEQSEYDDIDALKIDYRTLPRTTITTTSHDCLRRKCPYFGAECFVHGARRRAESADIVVTNHSLLFCDLAADGGLLPPIRYWVVDEAHGAEAEARRAFSLALSAEDILRLSVRASADEAARNVFVRAERHVVVPEKAEGAELFYALTGKARAAGKAYAEAAQEFTSHLKDLLFFETNKRGKSYDSVELWINNDIRQSETFGCVASRGRVMAETAEKLVTPCQELVGYLEGIEGAASIQREIASVAMELKDQIKAVKRILVQVPDAYAYAATLCRKNDKITDKLEALLLNVGDTLNDTLYTRTHSVVFASATLAVGEKFDTFEEALGLNKGEFSRCRSCKLNSSYDFDTQMEVYVASDMPEPNDQTYLPLLQKLLVETHLAQQGSMLTLFTNRREMESCFSVVQPALKADDLRLVCQKWGVSVKGLRDDFLADEHLSLFALKSFWEGFDAPGATLKGVIIPRLPFAKPTDPLSCERAARDDQAWRRYVLPQAVLEIKQAAGRLIRKADDTGVLILADKRLITKGYGKTFLESLPSRTIKVCTCAEIAEDLAVRASAGIHA